MILIYLVYIIILRVVNNKNVEISTNIFPCVRVLGEVHNFEKKVEVETN